MKTKKVNCSAKEYSAENYGILNQKTNPVGNQELMEELNKYMKESGKKDITTQPHASNGATIFQGSTAENMTLNK